MNTSYFSPHCVCVVTFLKNLLPSTALQSFLRGIACLSLLCGTLSHAEERITVDTDTVRFSRESPPAGLCLSFPNDDGDRAEFVKALRTSGMRTLRFPMGTLAENYLAHTPEKWAEAKTTGLQPMVASMKALKTDALHRAVQKDGHIGDQALDFDEYMRICKETRSLPVVLVSSHAHLLENSSVTRAQVISNAVEWVRYANLERGYGVTYWEIGNELDLAKVQKIMGREDYLALYREMAQAMKAVDPTIKTGLGIMSLKPGDKYSQEALRIFPELVDFIVAHDYCRIKGADDFANHNRSLVNSTRRALAAIDRWAPANRRDAIEVLVTEYSSHSPTKSWKHGGSTYDHSDRVIKGLVTAAMTIELAGLDPRVRASHFWVSRTPWGKNDPTAKDHSMFNDDLSLTAQGQFLAAAAGAIGRDVLQVDGDHSPGDVLATRDPESGRTDVLLINRRDTEAERVLVGIPKTMHVRAEHFSGDALARKADRVASRLTRDDEGNIRVTCPPYSLTTISASPPDK